MLLGDEVSTGPPLLHQTSVQLEGDGGCGLPALPGEEREGGGKNMHTKALVNKNNATAIFVRAVRVTACVIHIKMYIQTTMWPRFTR